MESIVRDDEDAGVLVVLDPHFGKTIRRVPYLGKRYIVSKDIG
jgi:hypothetical protein